MQVLKFIGFLDASNKPTSRYTDFRVGEKSKLAMAEALLDAYSELFALYPDAYNRPEQMLRDFFASKTKAGEQVIQKTVSTFTTLCEYANFKTEAIKKEGEGKPTGEGIKPPMPMHKEIALNINIQLVLPATEDASIYDKIFESLKKYILT